MTTSDNKFRKQRTIQFKLRAILMYENNKSIRATARKLGIQRASLKRWIRSKDILLNTNYKVNRNHAQSARKSHFPELERELDEYVNLQREAGAVITGPNLLNKARSIAFRNNIENFSGKLFKIIRIYILYNSHNN